MIAGKVLSLCLSYDELKKSFHNLLDKIRHMASRPIPEFNKFESLDLLEALKNAAQDTMHEKAGYYKFVFETLRGKINEPNEQFRNFLLPLLRDKDQEKVLEVVVLTWTRITGADTPDRILEEKERLGQSLTVEAVAFTATDLAMCRRIALTERGR